MRTNKAKKRAKTAFNKELQLSEQRIRARALIESGYSIPDAAKALGVSEGVVRNLLKEEQNNDKN